MHRDLFITEEFALEILSNGREAMPKHPIKGSESKRDVLQIILQLNLKSKY